MLEYVNDVIVPYVDRVRDDLGVDDGQAALALFDHFKGQMTSAITDVPYSGFFQRMEIRTIVNVCGLIIGAYT